METSLDKQLSKFWDLESLGIAKDEPPVYNKFVQQITFDGRRYEVRLPWKDNHPPLPDNRFTRVVFGVSSSPFLLNATIHHHMSSYMEDDPDFTKFLSSIYVDDIISGAADVDSAYTLYLKSRLRLATAGFRLRKFKTNSQELQTRIQQNEQTIVAEGTTEITEDKETGSGEETGSRSTNQEPITEGTQHIHVEDQSYAKIVLGNNCVTGDSTKSHKVL